MTETTAASPNQNSPATAPPPRQAVVMNDILDPAILSEFVEPAKLDYYRVRFESILGRQGLGERPIERVSFAQIAAAALSQRPLSLWLPALDDSQLNIPAAFFQVTWAAWRKVAFAWVLVALWIVLIALDLLAKPVIGISLFALILVPAVIGFGVLGKPVPPVGRDDRFGVLLLRGVLAGLLVAVVTMAAVWLGPDGSGLLLGFPIGYSIIATTVHDRYGAAMAAATLHSGLLGTVSLAGFCAALAFTVTVLPAPWPFLIGLAVSVLFTTTLVLMSRKRDNPA